MVSLSHVKMAHPAGSLNMATFLHVGQDDTPLCCGGDFLLPAMERWNMQPKPSQGGHPPLVGNEVTFFLYERD